jgi:hypothetical protein
MLALSLDLGQAKKAGSGSAYNECRSETLTIAIGGVQHVLELELLEPQSLEL